MSATQRCIKLWFILERTTNQNRKSVAELTGALGEAGYRASHRTVLRDLDVLSGVCPLQVRMEGNVGYWYALQQK